MQLKGWSICSGFGWSVCRGFAWSAWREFRWSVSADFPVQQLNINTKTSERRFRNSLDEIKLRNQQVVDQLKIRSDTLPPIKIY